MDGEAGEDKAYMAIVVLVVGVVGGLAAVITFIFLCKNCKTSPPPLTTTADALGKKHGDRERQGYHLLDPQVVLSPDRVPATPRLLLPQPSLDNNKLVQVWTRMSKCRSDTPSRTKILYPEPVFDPEMHLYFPQPSLGNNKLVQVWTGWVKM